MKTSYRSLCLSMLLCSGCSTTHVLKPNTSEGVAFKALRIERKIRDTDRATAILRNTLDRVSETFARLQIERPSLEALANIDQCLKGAGFKLKTNSILTFSASLEAGRLDCSDLSLIYAQVARETGFDLKVSRAPAHVFIVMPTGLTNEYWETTYGMQTSFEYYAKGIDPSSISNGTYLSISEAPILLSNVYHEMAMLCVREGYIRLAEVYTKKALELCPSNVEAWGGLGSIYYQMKSYRQAERALKEATRLDPANAAAFINLAAAYSALHEPEEEFQALKKGLELGSDNAEAYRRYLILDLARALSSTF